MKTIFILIIAVITGVTTYAQEHVDTILENAFAKASIENKNVFVKFEASWCGYCKRMDRYMQSAALKNYFNDNYVVAHIVVNESNENKHLENPGGAALLASYKGTKAGLPFFVITNPQGKLLKDSFNKEGQNLGCPVSETEVAYFSKILKETSALTEKEISQIAAVFLRK